MNTKKDRVEIRITQFERQTWEHQAKSAGFSLPEYIRWTMNDWPIGPVPFLPRAKLRRGEDGYVLAESGQYFGAIAQGADATDALQNLAEVEASCASIEQEDSVKELSTRRAGG